MHAKRYEQSIGPGLHEVSVIIRSETSIATSVYIHSIVIKWVSLINLDLSNIVLSYRYDYA